MAGGWVLICLEGYDKAEIFSGGVGGELTWQEVGTGDDVRGGTEGVK